MTKYLRNISLILGLAFISVNVFSEDMVRLDPLNMESTKSSRAHHVLITSVVRAADRLVACGERGVVMLSDDSGQSWHQADFVPVSVTLTKLYFVDADTGWAIGHSGVVLKTVDGGKHWKKQLDGFQAAQIELKAAEKDSANDSRMQAARYLVQDGADKPFLGIHFTDALHGIIVGAYGIAFATRDGGMHWESLIGRIADPAGRHLYAVVQQENFIYLAGEQGALFRSDDNSQSFSSLNVGWDGSLFGILPLGNKSLIAYGLRGKTFASTDQGESWKALNLPETSIVAGHILSDGAIVLADETGQLHLSKDATFFNSVGLPANGPISAFIESADKQLIFSGANNLSRRSLK
ncbi:WD40/YVTN/BNR-like repeat-containing protein [Candidatus Thalassolituus haligoni]|uniref:WD40/YVTN/BNR-like repeat-containing protein n=1 Tax=Candidatus Thalassolituus haligoni TaxID=3100113 RepID=UPI0035116D44|tara:strand:- start:27994 stop:29046 length:1053 start_codon:yes stop_codon:yes gene_type:complete